MRKLRSRSEAVAPSGTRHLFHEQQRVLGHFRKQLATPEQPIDPKVSVGMAMWVASLRESRDRKTATYCGNSGL